ncbi:methyl-accepting chemotaxis protein [Brevundimonas bacteroides]|uniref:methyl-accepting chemotaxis protein n=1 Tax=Brevundimonas bacteroides TaxID=74311 RepID=UPI000A0295FE|nr:methyl-accepting chemotaxis protein [Brevundimonas bacteroides]
MLKRFFATGVVAISLLVVLLIAGGGYAVSQIRIGGPEYADIIRDKDLVADILPPPAYVVEANLELSQAMLDPTYVELRKTRLAELKQQYDERSQLWLEADLPGDLIATLSEKVDPGAQEFWRTVEGSFLPAVERGDLAAAASAYSVAQAAYQQHREGVDQAVAQATALQAADEAGAQAMVQISGWALVLGALLLIAGLASAVWFVSGRILSPMVKMTEAMKVLARGETDIQIVGADRKDEIGEMARSLEVFRKNAVDLAAGSVNLLNASARMAAVDRSQAVIEFTLDGKILEANKNFLDVVGYSLAEIQGRHHSMFVDPVYAASPEYADFWRRLASGEFTSGNFTRYARGGGRVVLAASYNPIVDHDGKVCKVVKFASDITAVEVEREQRAEAARVAAEIQGRVVEETGAGLTALAAGNLAYRIDSDFPGDYAKLRSDFNDAMAKLEDAMGVITTNASAIQSGSSEISQAADDLSRRTEQQAATLEQTAAALDEITATVRRTAEGAQRANTVVTEARGDAEASGVVVNKAVAAMGEIERSADQISQIIGVIDEIAFQTNLLALNAGVEAARAGDAGRGFAVVASEVRALAQRSAEAAKEIKALISASTTQVKDGVSLVGQTGQALTAIVGRVSEINALMAEINASAQEQATALTQVNTAVNQMDQTTQQNAAMVEESTAASHSLNQEAQELARLVSRFQISGVSARPVSPAVASPAAARAAKAAAAPVHTAQTRIAEFAKGQATPRRATAGNTALAQAADDWEEF